MAKQDLLARDFESLGIGHDDSTRFKGFQNLMRKRIRDVLLVSSLYDLYLFEEDGRLYELILSEYQGLHLSHSPELTRVSSGREAVELAQEERRFDLIITTLHIEDMTSLRLVQMVREAGLDIPVVLLAYDNRELKDLITHHDTSIFDGIFIWQGDFRLIIAIIKHLEDKMNVDHDTRLVGVQSIILIEDNVRYYSSYLPIIYSEVLNQSQRLIHEGVNLTHRYLRMRARPKILLCKTYEEAMQYFRQKDEVWSNDFTNQDGDTDAGACTGSNPTDPFCFESAAIKVECCKSYVLVISSGEYSHDFTKNIFGDADNTESVANTPPTRCKSTLDNGACTADSEATVANGGWLDDVAYYAHVTDLRPTDLGGMQNLGIYTINTFGGFSGSGGYNREGTHVLKQAAKYGGFEDIDGDGELDAGEWDKNADGIPDTYFAASGGSNLKATIMAAVMQILKSSASGTSVSVLSTSAGGQGAIYQAYFFPSKLEGEADDRVWPGYMRSFFIDRHQNLRDDASGGTYTTAGDGSTTFTGAGGRTGGDGKLTVANIADGGDYVATMHLDSEYQVRVRLVEDDDGIDVSLTADEDPHIDDVVSLWEAGKQLALKTKSTRNIYVWYDEDFDGLVDDGDFTTDGPELMPFNDSKKTLLAPVLRASDPDNPPYTNYTGALTAADEAEDIIDFIRGEYVTGYRNRCITVDGSTKETNNGTRRSDCESAQQRVWPLGDIIYSTPTLVSDPGEKYDEIYGDASYRLFRSQYKGRRNMIYVGANDGMLHAFNAGFFDPVETKFCKGPDGADANSTIEGLITTAGSECATGTYDLGEEMWGFIPHDNLPHLAWLACNGTASDPTACGADQYTHVYYVDERPKVSDVKIFDDTDADHPGGWGTILIMGMRYGGGAMDLTFAGSSTVNEFRSAYYMFDITDPEAKPELLGRYSDDSLGFTLSYPSITRVKDSGGNERWFAVFGSGPENLTGTAARDYKSSSTTQNGSIHVIEITKDGFDLTAGHSNIFDTTHGSSIMGDPAAVDVDLDFSVDVIYIGSSKATTDGKIYRLNTQNNIDPTTWLKSELLFDADMGPLLVPPSASMDTVGNFWVYFGTGRLRSKDDMTSQDQQRFYAIKDDCWRDLTVANGCTASGGPDGHSFVRDPDLFNSTDIVVTPNTGASNQVVSAEGWCGGGSTCSYQDLINHVQTKKGWYVNLYKDAANIEPSERVLARSAVLGGLLLFSTYQPLNDVCSVFGQSNLYALYYETGTAYDKPIFEGNLFDSSGNDTGVDINETAIAGKLNLGAGMPTAVGIAVGETVTGFVQKSTGEIVRIKAAPGLGVRSGISSWREKTKGGGTVEIEETYKHIVK